MRKFNPQIGPCQQSTKISYIYMNIYNIIYIYIYIYTVLIVNVSHVMYSEIILLYRIET